MKARWRGAEFFQDEDAGVVQPMLDRIFVDLDRQKSTANPFRLLLRGTNFQVQVWRAVLHS
ncbi:MAG: hypothetical protein R3C68_09375 [Myxococcota bacterium]